MGRAVAYSCVVLHVARYRRAAKWESVLCQNCVTYPLKPPVNTVSYEDMSMRIDVA